MTDWEGPESCEVGIPQAGCVWAPEAIFDEEKQEFLVFWASMVKEEGDEAPKQRIYASRTKDFPQLHSCGKVPGGRKSYHRYYDPEGGRVLLPLRKG